MQNHQNHFPFWYTAAWSVSSLSFRPPSSPTPPVYGEAAPHACSTRGPGTPWPSSSVCFYLFLQKFEFFRWSLHLHCILLFLSIPSTLSKRGLDYDECTDGRQVYGHSFTVECYRQYVLLFACMFLPCCTPPLWRTTTHYLSNKVHHVFPSSVDNTMLPRRICNCHCEHKPRSGESVGMCVCGCVCLYLPFIIYILLLNGEDK